MTQYIATLRAVYDAKDEVEAIFIADKILENGSVDLEDDDTFSVTQVTSNTISLTPQEITDVLLRARNILIRTRIRDCFQQARELDRIIYLLGFQEEDWEYASAGYSYGNFMDAAEAILMRGESPIN